MHEMLDKRHYEEKKTKEKQGLFSPFTVTRSCCGLYHSLVIGKRKSLPYLYGWGRNYNNVLCLGPEISEKSHPTSISYFGKHNVFQVSCGLNHTAILVKLPNQAGGRVYTCGLGNKGRLGYTKTNEKAEKQEDDSWFSHKPSRVVFPNKKKISRISCGSDHSLAISESGELFAWGIGQYGNLGTGKMDDVYDPVRIAIGNDKTFIIHCSAGSKHSLACAADGRVYSWGHNGNGRLGLGHLRVVLSPTLIESCSESEIVYVSAGEAHSACITKMGVLYTWGAGSYGRLGHGDDIDTRLPRKVETFGGVPLIQVACGTFYTMAVARSGVLYGWGSSLGLGLLAEGDKTAVLLPKPIRQGGLSGSVCQVSVGTYHTIALTSNGNVFCWGVGGQSRLGHGTDANQPFPKHIAELRNKAYLDDIKHCFLCGSEDREGASLGASQNLYEKKVQSVQCGETHTMILLANGEVWVWGSNSHGQLGLTNHENQETVYKPVLLDAFKDPIACIACGQKHSLAANIRGELYVWGAGDQGQLGLGRLTDVAVPTGVSTVVGVFSVFAGDDYSACLASAHVATNIDKTSAKEGIHAVAGDLWTWGSCEAGKLGHEGLLSGSCLFPRRVKLSVPLSMVACGVSHMLACTTTGKVFAWGAGYYGRLGIGSSGNSCIPVLTRFPDDIFITSVYAGAFHSLAISSEGAIYVWGRNTALCNRDHLMCPSLFEKLSSVGGVPRCKAIATYGEHTLAVTCSGEVWAWGDNKNFQLGCDNKNTTFFSKPELVVNIKESVDYISTSVTHTLAVLRSNDLVAWGHNNSGCLGIGVKKQKFCMVPTRVMNPWTLASRLEAMSQASSVAVGVGSSMLSGYTHTGYEIIPRDGNNTDLSNTSNEKRINEFLHALRSRMENKVFSYLQDILKKEPEECRFKELTAQEDDLIKVLSYHLSIILKMDEPEKALRFIELQVQRKLARIIMSLPCDAPDVFLKKNQLVPDFFNERLGTIKQLVEYFLFQPSYFVHLASCIHQDLHRGVLVEMTKQLYWNIEDRHINGIFLSLCAAICTKEVEAASDLLRLFEPDKSNFMALFSAYSLQAFSKSDFYRFFLDPKYDRGMGQAVENLGDFCLVLDPKNLYDLFPEYRNKPDEYQHWFSRSLESIHTIMSTLVQQITFPVGLAALLKHAYFAIVARDFDFDAYIDKGGRQQLNLYYPLVRLFLYGVVCRLFNDSAYWNKHLLVTAFESPYAESNFRNLGIFLSSAFENNFSNYHEVHLFREIFKMSYCQSVDRIMHAMNQVNEEFIHAENTLSFFTMHFDMEPYIVTIQSNIIACLLNLLKQYEAYLQLSVYDPVSEALRLICDGNNYVFTEDMIKILHEAPSYHNLRIDRRFLLREKNVVFDTLTGVPVPQSLAPRQQAAMREGKAIIALINRYTGENPLDPRILIGEALRLSPTVSAENWEKLAEQFTVLQEFYTRQSPPDFTMAQLLGKTISFAENFSDQQVSCIDCCKWIAERMQQRQRHHWYLSMVQKNEDAIFEAERNYRFITEQYLQKMKENINLINEFYIEPEIREKLQENNMVPQFDLLRRILPLETDDVINFHPTLSFPLQLLITNSIIAYTTIVPTTGSHYTLNFTLNPKKGWTIQMVQTVQMKSHEMDHFEISNDEIAFLSELPSTSTISYGKNIIYFNVANLLNFLLRASVQSSLISL